MCKRCACTSPSTRCTRCASPPTGCRCSRRPGSPVSSATSSSANTGTDGEVLGPWTLVMSRGGQMKKRVPQASNSDGSQIVGESEARTGSQWPVSEECGMRFDIVNDDARHRRGRAHGVSRAGGVVCRLRRGVKLSESTRPRVSQTRCRWHRGGTIGGAGLGLGEVGRRRRVPGRVACAVCA